MWRGTHVPLSDDSRAACTARASSAGEGWEVVGRATTDADGRARELMPPGAATSGGRYRLIFDTEAYFGAAGRPAFYPQVAVQFVGLNACYVVFCALKTACAYSFSAGRSTFTAPPTPASRAPWAAAR